jgi:hypothetical protein
MGIVVRLGPLPLGHRRLARVVELERIFGDIVDLVEESTATELASAVERLDVAAVALDASPPAQFIEAVTASGSIPVLRPLWRRQRNARGDVDELFDGYGHRRARRPSEIVHRRARYRIDLVRADQDHCSQASHPHPFREQVPHSLGPLVGGPTTTPT